MVACVIWQAVYCVMCYLTGCVLRHVLFDSLCTVSCVIWQPVYCVMCYLTGCVWWHVLFDRLCTVSCVIWQAVYGVMGSIEGCQAFQDLCEHTQFMKWYKPMKEQVQQHKGLTENSSSSWDSHCWLTLADWQSVLLIRTLNVMYNNMTGFVILPWIFVNQRLVIIYGLYAIVLYAIVLSCVTSIG